jgi:hypothetical protein
MYRYNIILCIGVGAGAEALVNYTNFLFIYKRCPIQSGIFLGLVAFLAMSHSRNVAPGLVVPGLVVPGLVVLSLVAPGSVGVPKLVISDPADLPQLVFQLGCEHERSHRELP